MFFEPKPEPITQDLMLLAVDNVKYAQKLVSRDKRKMLILFTVCIIQLTIFVLQLYVFKLMWSVVASGIGVPLAIGAIHQWYKRLEKDAAYLEQGHVHLIEMQQQAKSGELSFVESGHLTQVNP